MNLRTVKAYLLMEDFQRFWDYTYPAWAEKFLQRWCFRTMRSNIEPMKDIAKMLRRHQELILNWFRAKKQFNNGIVEGLNLKWNLTVRKAFGFRTFTHSKWPHSTSLLSYPNHNSPTNSTDEPKLFKTGTIVG